MKIIYAFIPLFLFACLTKAQQRAVIIGSGKLLPDGDTIRVVVYKFNTTGFDARLYDSYGVPIKNNSFTIALKDIRQPTEITIFESKNKFQTFDHYLIFPGDSINLNWSEGQLNFSGLHYEMFGLLYRLRKINLETKLPDHMRAQNFQAFVSKFDSISNAQQKILEEERNSVNALAYSMLKDEVKRNPLISSMYILNYIGGGPTADPVVRSTYERQLKSRFDNFGSSGYVSDSGLDFLISRYKLDSCDFLNRRFISADFVKYVDLNFQGQLRDRLMTHFLMKSHDLSGEAFIPLIDFAHTMQDSTLCEIVKEFATSITNGRNAYNFTLPDTKGNIVSLSDYRGKVVVLDFWFTGCPGCRVLAPHLKNAAEELKRSGIKFVSISIDKSLTKWKNSIAEGVYTTSSVVNLNAGQNISGETTIKKYKVLAYPSLYIIDKHGRVVNVEVDPRIDNGKEFIKQLKSLI